MLGADSCGKNSTRCLAALLADRSSGEFGHNGEASGGDDKEVPLLLKLSTVIGGKLSGGLFIGKCAGIPVGVVSLAGLSSEAGRLSSMLMGRPLSSMFGAGMTCSCDGVLVVGRDKST